MPRQRREIVLPVEAPDVASAVAVLRSRTRAHGWRGPRVRVRDDGTVRLRQNTPWARLPLPLLDGRLTASGGRPCGVELRALVRESAQLGAVSAYWALLAVAAAAACVGLVLTEHPVHGEALWCGVAAPALAAASWWMNRGRAGSFATDADQLTATVASLLAAADPAATETRAPGPASGR